MAKSIELGGTLNANFPLSVKLSYARWPRIFTDQWSLPKFRIEVRNQGELIEECYVEVVIFEFSQVEGMYEVPAYKGPFQNILNFDGIKNFSKKGKFVRRFQIQSRFLKEGEFIMRVAMFRLDIEDFDPKVDTGMRSTQLFDLKGIEKIKVHSLSSLMGVYAKILGFIGLAGGAIWGLGNWLFSNWSNIVKFFESVF